MDCNDDIFAKCYPHLAFTSKGIGAPCPSFQGIVPQLLAGVGAESSPMDSASPQTSAGPGCSTVSPNYGYTLTVEEKQMFLPEGMRSLATTPCMFNSASPASELTRQFEEDLEVELINESMSSAQAPGDQSATTIEPEDHTQFLPSPYNYSGSSFTSRSSSFLPSYAKKLHPQQIQTDPCSEGESDWANLPGTSYSFALEEETDNISSKFRPLLTPNSELKRSHASTDSPNFTVERPIVTRPSLDSLNWFKQSTQLPDLPSFDLRDSKEASLVNESPRASLVSPGDFFAGPKQALRGFVPEPLELPQPPRHLLKTKMAELQSIPGTSDSWEDVDEGQLAEQMESLLKDAKKKTIENNMKANMAAKMEKKDKNLANVVEIFAIPEYKMKDDVVTAVESLDVGNVAVYWLERKAVFAVFDDAFDADKVLRMIRHEWLRFRNLDDSPQHVKDLAKENVAKLAKPKSKVRQKTNVTVARRMVENALNQKSNVSKEKRAEQRDELQRARDAKKKAPKWDD